MCSSFLYVRLYLGNTAIGDHFKLASNGSQECSLGLLWSRKVYGGNELYLGLGLGVYSVFPFALGVLVGSFRRSLLYFLGRLVYSGLSANGGSCVSELMLRLPER